MADPLVHPVLSPAARLEALREINQAADPGQMLQAYLEVAFRDGARAMAARLEGIQHDIQALVDEVSDGY